jgi:hypothetical protein
VVLGGVVVPEVVPVVLVVVVVVLDVVVVVLVLDVFVVAAAVVSDCEVIGMLDIVFVVFDTVLDLQLTGARISADTMNKDNRNTVLFFNSINPFFLEIGHYSSCQD